MFGEVEGLVRKLTEPSQTQSMMTQMLVDFLLNFIFVRERKRQRKRERARVCTHTHTCTHTSGGGSEREGGTEDPKRAMC